jgi:Chromosome segregation ATPases
LDNEVSEAENEYLKKKNNLELLNKASGAIQDAISIIRKNLLENQRTCPVCQADYEPEVLVKRIEKSLETLNPAIPQAIEEEKKALVILEGAKEKQSKENQKLQDMIYELNTERNKIEENQKTINEKFLPQFPGLKVSGEAHLYIEEQILKITSEIKELETMKNQLDPYKDEKINNASSVFDVLRDYITEYNYQIMMSTHDSIQARFFQRKLENEGIPSKIYQLVDRKGGVTAERIM